ncbi:MAG: hypothetical protein WDO14_18110 [Bacteroidota bacterium]
MKLTLTHLLFIICFALLSFEASSQSNVVSDLTEFNALKALWDSTNGAGWTNNTNWPVKGSWPSSATAAQMDTWNGIVVTNGDITEIVLTGNNLDGIIPSGVGNLSALKNLTLYTNKLHGTMPTALGNLTNLTKLYLYGNQIEGPIPSQLGSLTKMNYIDLHNNRLSGTVPPVFTPMTQLLLVDLSSNRLTGTLPTLLGTQILVNNNLLTGAFPSISSTTVTLLNATNNGFTSIPSGVSSWGSLLTLNFSQNELTSLPSSLLTRSGRSSTLLSINGNRLDFGTLEAVGSAAFKTGSVLVPQNNIADNPTQAMEIGNALVITARPLGSNSTLTWEKQTSTGTWAAAGNDQDATAQTYTRNAAAASDGGAYRWKTTNTGFSGTTIMSEAIVIKTAAGFKLDNWCFQYKYDERRRMVEKKVPGAGWVYMVYDDRDRVVMTQDGTQRLNKQWMFTRYDVLNRPVMTGLYKHTTAISRAGMDSLISSTVFYESWNDTTRFGYTNNVMPSSFFPGTFEPLTITYYDDYRFVRGDAYFAYRSTELSGQYNYSQSTAFTRLSGQVTGTWTKVLGKDRQWIRTVNYFDDRGRVVQTITDDHKRGQEINTSVYDFTGKVTSSRTTITDHRIVWNQSTSAAAVMQREDRLVSNNTSTNSAYSLQQIAASGDGWAEFTVSSDSGATSTRWLGLSNGTPGTIAYGVKQVRTPTSCTVQSLENGTLQGTALNVGSGDVIRIERKGTTMYYSRNGYVFRSVSSVSTASLSPHAQLITNAADLNTNKAELYNPRVSVNGTTHTIERHFESDHAGRLLKTWHKLDDQSAVLLVDNKYNELGQLADKNLHSTDTTNFRQSLDYRYNIRGWLTSINGAQLNADGGKNPDVHTRRDLFGIDLLYDKGDDDLDNSALYSGNISAMKWSNNLGLGTMKARAYKFDYDAMNRLLSATQKTLNNTLWSSSGAYKEFGVTYDLNGNIRTLLRTDGSETLMDSLKYNYSSGNLGSNMLRKVGDKGTEKGFTDALSLADDYTYDVNGNMKSDKNKSITLIDYNHLNLPSYVKKSTGEYLTYTYDAAGRKLAQDVYSASNVLTKRSDYRGELFYENDTLRFVNHEEGRAVPVGTWTAASQLLSNPDMTTTTGYVGWGTSVSVSTQTIGSETYLKVVNTVEQRFPGFLSGSVYVVPGRQYKIRLKGYNTSASQVTLYAQMGGSASGDILYPGPALASSEGWVEAVVTIPKNQINYIRVGALFMNTVATGSTIYVNRMEVYEYNPPHGTSVFSQTGYEYQYHLKDHLGNVRMTFTTRDEVDSATATVDNANATAENSEFLNYDKVRRVNHPVYDHTYDHSTSPDGTTYAMRLNGSSNERIGLAKSISVMPGDTLKIEVFAKYYEPPVTPNSGLFTLLMAAITGGTAPGGVVVDGSGYLTNYSTTVPGVALDGKSNEDSGPPKAYLNWLVFDRDYNLIASKSGYKRITTAAKEDSTNVPHERIAPDDDLIIDQAGYVYIYLSNENEVPVEVYFDDFKVEHIKSPVIESQSYYPFGLTFDHYQRENSSKNSYLYNQGADKKKFNTERVIELDLNVDQSKYRTYDFITGRWWQVDPKSEAGQESWSTYQFAFDNPIRYNDPEGDCIPCIGAIVGAVVGAGINIYQQSQEGTLDWGSGRTWARVGTAALGGGIAGTGYGGVVGGGIAAAGGEAADQMIANGSVTDPQKVLINGGAGAATGAVLKGLEAVAVKTGIVAVAKAEANAIGKTAFVAGAKGLRNAGNTTTTGRTVEGAVMKVSKATTETINGLVSYLSGKAVGESLAKPKPKPEEKNKINKSLGPI